MCVARDKFRNRVDMGDLVIFSRQGELDVGVIDGVYKYAEDSWAVDIVTYKKDYGSFFTRKVKYSGVKQFLKLDNISLTSDFQFRKEDYEIDFRK